MNNGGTILSPLTGKHEARFVSAIDSSHIIEQYRKQYDIDVSDYFRGMPQVNIYECAGTGFQFFHPESLAGKESLYRHLGKFPWFYQENKWEHVTTLPYFQEKGKILDVGCGNGDFLLLAKREKNAEVSGIEFNPDSVQSAKDQGLDVFNENIDQHAERRKGYYDAVCTFQVLEHISRPGPFIEKCLDLLKPGGIFIVGVPNNDGFLKYDPNAVLNTPPHHMGLWTRKSLTALSRIFPIKVVGVEIEPLNNIDWYKSVMERRYLPERWLRSLYYRLGGAKRFKQYITDNASSIAGHTILIVYRKIDKLPG